MKHLTKEELSRLLSVAKAENELHWLAILVAYNHGLRASEITDMRGGQVSQTYLTVPRLKGSVKTTQFLMGEEIEPLRRLAALRGKTGRLFPFSSRWFQIIVKKYGEKAGIDPIKCHPHALKHTCAMLAIEKGIPVNVIQAHLGHKSLSSTGEYLKVSSEAASKIFAETMSHSETNILN